MKIAGFTSRKDEKGNDYVTFAEDITKTRQSGLHEKDRLTLPKIFETSSDCCLLLFSNFIYQSVFKIYRTMVLLLISYQFNK